MTLPTVADGGDAVVEGDDVGADDGDVGVDGGDVGVDDGFAGDGGDDEIGAADEVVMQALHLFLHLLGKIIPQ